MEVVYIEFLEELYWALNELEHTWWAKWMQKSIEKFKFNQDVSYFLRAFGGMGSFNDEFLVSEISEELSTITYQCARAIQDKEDIQLENILLKEKERLLSCINRYSENTSMWEQRGIERATMCLNYINMIINNYKVGNLHQLTQDYSYQGNKGKHK